MARGTPSPRKERPASVRMAPATPNVATTMSEALTFGSTWRQHDPGERDAQGPGGVDERLLADGQRLGPHDPGVGAPVAQTDDQDDVADARAQHRRSP